MHSIEQLCLRFIEPQKQFQWKRIWEFENWCVSNKFCVECIQLQSSTLSIVSNRTKKGGGGKGKEEEKQCIGGVWLTTHKKGRKKKIMPGSHFLN